MKTNTQLEVNLNDQIARFQTKQSPKLLYFQGENCCKQENKPNWIPKAKHNSKTCETEKLIVNSLRLLHETFLYFEIGSNQVANNDNNFCNKIKHETNPHEFNNFATQEHFSYIFLYSLFYYAHTYILIRITQPTDFLPSNYINFYVRQLIINSKATKNAYVLNEQISKLHTQHTEWHVALPEQKKILQNYLKPIKSKNTSIQ